jgi:autotransporter-associated beta strand protein
MIPKMMDSKLQAKFSHVFVALEYVRSVPVLTLHMVNGGKISRQRQFPVEKVSGRIVCVLLAALFCAGAVAAQDGYWIDSSGASWAGAGNWDPADGIAGGADNTAYFGFSREASISPNASFSLGGAQTIGNLFFTTQGGPANWSFNPGSGGSLTLEGTFGPPQITVTSPSLQVSLNAVVAGTSGVEKDGAGTLVLAAQNSYTGSTLVKGGGLNVTGTVETGGVTVNNATLSGTGVIMGPVVIGSGGVLVLGNPLGPLTINNSLVLLAGSTTSVAVNAATPGRAAVQGLSSVTYGGTLLVSGLSGALSLGQSFSIFGNVPASGNFTSIQPPPGPWQRWSFNPATGQITVVSSASQPAFASVSLAGTSLVYQVTSGPPGSPCYIMATADLAQPMTAWTRIATNVFDMNGAFTATSPLSANGAGQTYLAAFVIPSP